MADRLARSARVQVSQSNTDSIRTTELQHMQLVQYRCGIFAWAIFRKRRNSADLPKESERFADFLRFRPEFRAIAVSIGIAAERYEGEAGKVSVKGMVTIRYV